MKLADVRATANAHTCAARRAWGTRRGIATTAALACAAMAITAGVGVVTSHKEVTVEVDGVSRPVGLWGTTTKDVLAAVGVTPSDHDLVSPGLHATIRDGDTVLVRTANPMTLSIDGQSRTIWTTATSADSILADAGRLAAASVSLPASRAGSRATLVGLVSRPQTVAVVAGQERTSVKLRPGDDVRTALATSGVTLHPNDRVSIASGDAGLEVHVDAVTRGTVATSVPVPFDEQVERSDDLFEGESDIKTPGVEGHDDVLEWREQVGDRITHTVTLSQSRAADPVTQVRVEGTKKATPEALLQAGIDPKAQLEEHTEGGVTTVRYRARLGSISTPEEIAQLTTAAQVANVPLTYSGEDPRSLAKPMVESRGWSDTEFQCLVSLWNRESHWNPYAANPSGAYGIPQALPGSKMASAGADWQSNPVTQIQWGLGYIAGRYGTPCAAWSHSNSVGWY